MNSRRALTVAALTSGALYAGYLCILYFMQGALIYPGTGNRVDTPSWRSERGNSQNLRALRRAAARKALPTPNR